MWDGWYDRDGKPFGDEPPRGARGWPNNKRVGVTKISEAGITVSTVHLGLDHRYGDGPPLIFETMIFGGEHDQDCRRYATEEDAMRGHLEALSRLRTGRAPFGGDDE